MSRFQYLLCLLAFLGPTTGAEGVELASHRAFYELSLADADPQSGVDGVTGRMSVSFDNFCDGYSYDQRIVSRVVDSRGRMRVTDFHVSSFENRDGTLYRFAQTDRLNGLPIEDREGRAETAPDGTVKVTLEGREARALTLPVGTTFPIAYSRAVIAALQEGERGLSLTAFDESAPEFVMETDVVLVTERSASEGGGPLREGRTSWRVQVSYYEMGSMEATPEYQVAVTLYDNGVADDLLLDYGDFALKGDLVRLEPGEQPNC